MPVTPLRAAARRLVETLRDAGPLWTASLVLEHLFPCGVLGLWPDRTVRPEALAAQVEAILRAWGMSPEHATITVEHMLYADLHGIDSHGCAMLPHYYRGMTDGSVTVTPTVTVIRESQTTGLVDGGGGLGHVPGDTAMKLAIAKCRDTGLGAVAVRNSGHYGAAGAYVSMAARSGFIGLATTNTRMPALVPTFAREAMLGTNPIAFAAPTARNPPFLLDMATSTVPLGKLAMHRRRGRPIPAGWALDSKGQAVTSARRAVRYRRLTPLGSRPEMGSHKGYGLAAVVEILSASLAGPGCGRGVRSAGRVGHFFLALDPRRFGDAGAFEADVDGLIDVLHAAAPIDPGQPVLVAGDPEHATYRERRRGIPLCRGVIEDLRAVARASAVRFMLDPEE
jgi:LDH2 family malate/lactate/ureidoglycolate dehydrogenase